MMEYATRHGFTPSVGNPFADPTKCRVMLARYVCPYSETEHDPARPAEDVDAFGYIRPARVCDQEKCPMWHGKGCPCIIPT